MTHSEIKIIRGENNTVVAGQVTKTFFKRANIFGTPEYEKWEKFIEKNPEAKMMVITTSKTKRKAKPAAEKAVRPSYDKMIDFINVVYKNDKASIESYIDAMNKIKNMAAINGNSYHMVVKWFNITFENRPEYKTVFRSELPVNPVETKTADIAAVNE